MRKLIIILLFLIIFAFVSCNRRESSENKKYDIEESLLFLELTDPRVYPDNMIPGVNYGGYYLFDQTVDFYTELHKHHLIMKDQDNGIRFLDEMMFRKGIKGYKWCMTEKASLLVFIIKNENQSESDNNLYEKCEEFSDSFENQYLIKNASKYCFLYISDDIETFLKYDLYIYSGCNVYEYKEKNK